MADLFDIAGDFMGAMIRESRKTAAGQLQRELDPRMAQMDAWADRRKKQQVMRRMQESQEARDRAEAQRREQMRAQSSDDGIGLGGAALIGGALLGLGALAYNALSKDDNASGTAVAKSSTTPQS